MILSHPRVIGPLVYLNFEGEDSPRIPEPVASTKGVRILLFAMESAVVWTTLIAPSRRLTTVFLLPIILRSAHGGCHGKTRSFQTRT